MRLDIEGFHDRIRDLHTGGINGGDQMGLNGESGRSGSLVDVMQEVFKGAQRTARPGLADFTEETMLDRVPLGSTGWVMANGHNQTEAICQFLL
mgnify:CR=1 FL=1